MALRRDPWYAQFDLLLPVDSNTYSVLQAACRWHAVGQTTGIRLRALRVAAVFPGEWNQQLQQLQGKGELLTRTTLELVRDCAQQLPPGPLRVHCDKHGGRNRYGPLLQQIFPEYLVEVRRESRSSSTCRSWRIDSVSFQNRRASLGYPAVGRRVGSCCCQ